MQKANVPSIPRAERVLRRANCIATDLVGDCVKITGPKVGSLFQVTKIDITLNGERQAVGVITKKTSSTLCVVQFFGPMIGVYTGLTAGERYFVDASSRLTLSPPGPAGGIVYVQLMGVAADSNELMLMPSAPIKRTGL